MVRALFWEPLVRALAVLFASLVLLSACSKTTETDPVFKNSPSAEVTSADIEEWNETAATVADAGPLVEQDPTFAASPAASIASTDVTRWNDAYAWGDHASAGYLKSEVDPKVGALADGDVPRWSAETGSLGSGAISDVGPTVTLGTGSSTLPLVVRGVQTQSAVVDVNQPTLNGPFFPSGPIIQTFVSGQTGLLVAVELRMDPGATYDLTLADAGGTALGTAHCVGADTGWSTCDFLTPAQVVAATAYRLVVTPESAGRAIGVAISDLYPDGALTGGGAPADATWDLTFRTKVGSLESEPLLEVGARVNVRSLLHLEPRSAPTSPAEGDIYYDAGDHQLHYWNGSSWVSF
jgi:hypothetical protein